jgi:hypothetical protein
MPDRLACSTATNDPVVPASAMPARANKLALAPVVGNGAGSPTDNSTARSCSTPATAVGVSSHAAASEAIRRRSCDSRGSP